MPLSTIILCCSSYKGKLWDKTVSKTVSSRTYNIERPHICLSIKILALQNSAEEPACKIRFWKLNAQDKVNNKINFMILDNFSVQNDIL